MKGHLSVTVEKNIIDKIDEIAKKTKRPISYVVQWCLKPLITKDIKEKLEAIKEGIGPETITERNRNILQKMANEVLGSVIEMSPPLSIEQISQIRYAIDRLTQELRNRVE